MVNTMSGNMQWNIKSIIICSGIGVAILYIVYSWLARPTKVGKLTLYSTWKTHEFKDIPINIKEKMTSIKIDEHHLSLPFDGNTYDIFSRQVKPENNKEALNILLLHGAAFSSKDWLDTKTLELIGALGHKAVAIDVPGWGNSQGSRLSDNRKGAFLAKFIEQENLGTPIIVSPSMSGSFSIPYIMGEPFKADTCQNRAKGFIPIAPVGTSKYTHGQYHKCEIPTMIVYGVKDKQLGLHSLNDLRTMSNNEIMPIEDAGHPCYIEKPEEWRRLLYNYIISIEKFDF